MKTSCVYATAAAALALCFSGGAWAQCSTIDFDDYAVGTEITSQYEGVTFSAPPGSCSWPIYPIIVEPGDGTTSGTKALGIMTGCPDFSPDYLRMVFDEPRNYVTFTLGEQVSTGVSFYVRGYTEAGDIIFAQTYETGAGVYHLVQVGAPDWPAKLKRIEIESPMEFFECIDDLNFSHDTTAPTAQIDSPTHADCLCEPSVIVTGIACDFDGDYDRDRLEYRPVGAPPGSDWTFIDEVVGSPVCDPGNLYTWWLADVPSGWHYLRLTVINACGLETTDTVTVYVDKAFGTINIDYPQKGDTICGEVEIKGTVNDGCGKCFDYYIVQYKPTSGGSWKDVDPAQPKYDTIVIDGDLAVWDTTKVPDDEYVIRVHGWDDCGNSEYTEVLVKVQASACGCLEDITGDGTVDVLDLLELLSAWGPCP